MQGIGQRRWVIAEGYLPGWSRNAEPELQSHETACLLNTSDREAAVSVTIYFNDREPLGPYRLVVPARRTRHLRFDELRDPAPIPRQTDFASVIDSDVPVVVQHTRLDARASALGLLSTVAYGAD